MPSLISVPLTASGPVIALSTPILIGSRDPWAAAVAPLPRAAMAPRTMRLTIRVLFMMILPPLVARERGRRPNRFPSLAGRHGLRRACPRRGRAPDEAP